jgi:hypothetical protein
VSNSLGVTWTKPVLPELAAGGRGTAHPKPCRRGQTFSCNEPSHEPSLSHRSAMGMEILMERLKKGHLLADLPTNPAPVAMCSNARCIHSCLNPSFNLIRQAGTPDLCAQNARCIYSSLIFSSVNPIRQAGTFADTAIALALSVA